MGIVSKTSLFMILSLAIQSPLTTTTEDKPPTQTVVKGPEGLSLVVRMQGPYDAAVPLQIVCYFEKTETSDAKLFGAPVDLDERLGGIIASLRTRAEFKGERYETFLIEPPQGSIQAKRLLLIGLGAEEDLSLECMASIGRTALREAVRTGSKSVAFAPMIKDAGNDKLAAGDVETAVVRGMLLAYDTEKRLQKQGFASSYSLEEWIVEAGPTYYDETIAGVAKAVVQAKQSIEKRDASAYSKKSK